MDGDRTPTKIVIYEALLSFLEDACSARHSRPIGDVELLQKTVKDYMALMSYESVLGAVVESLEWRKRLLELSTEMGLTNDPNLRTALRADEERIATTIVSILSSKSDEEAVLRLEGDSAQRFLDVVQDALDRGFMMGQEHNRMAMRIIRKLSKLCDKLPSSLFIIGVNDRDEHPTFGGGYGDIYRASYGDKRVALKRMRHFLRGSDLRRIRLKFCREALVWKDLHHPHILPFLGIDRDSFPSSLCMVSPWMDHGTVVNYLNTHGHANLNKVLYEIAQGLQYLHSRNIVHGDLRGANILIKEDWSACLADFGLSIFSDATSSMSTNRGGSLYWMAPELLDPDRFKVKFALTPATDVYAFGCVCLELYTGRPPFAGLSEPAALMKVLAGERPERPPGPPAMSDMLWHHVTEFLAHNPPARPLTRVVVQNMIWPTQAPRPSPPFPLLPGERSTLSPPSTPIGKHPGLPPPAIKESFSSTHRIMIPADEGRHFPPIPPLEKGRFDNVYKQFCKQRRLVHNPRMMTIDTCALDLYDLHTQVMLEGGAVNIALKGLWSVVGGRMGFIQFPASGTEPAKSGPGVAQHLAHVYKEYLAAFDHIYISALMDSRRKDALMAAQRPMGMGGVGGGPGPGGRPGGIADPSQMQLMAYANIPLPELCHRGIPEQLIQSIEANRSTMLRDQTEALTFRNQLMQRPDPSSGPIQGGQQPQQPSIARPSRESDLQAAMVHIAKLKSDYSQERLLTDMPAMHVPAEQHREYNAVLEQLHGSCVDLDYKLPMLFAVLKKEDVVRRLVIIVQTAIHQRAMISSGSTRFLVTLETLHTMLQHAEHINERFATILAALVESKPKLPQKSKPSIKAAAALPLPPPEPATVPSPADGNKRAREEAPPPQYNMQPSTFFDVPGASAVNEPSPPKRQKTEWDWASH
ncbi:Kinase-like protein [Mycena venus]|uniref:Kinase-like protein n=1 Tax=Mycena venus TaxID=2733690 RepID=A0A8H6YLD0_9AGAR|nr:Kinase-like protein [Mycena venus]